MSLFDYLNNDPTSSASSGSSVSTQIAQLLQQAAAKKGATASTTTATGASGNSASSVLITLDAQRANAASADASKDAATLASELRATLDKQYDGKTDKSPNVTAFSGRALAMIALNQDGKFSRAEVDAAKSELRERDRAAAIAFLNSGDVTAASLKTYSQQLLATRQSMSAEERQLRDSDPNLR